MRKYYLKNHRPVLWNLLVLRDTLREHLHETDDEANARFDAFLERYGVTEELKATDGVGLQNE